MRNNHVGRHADPVAYAAQFVSAPGARLESLARGGMDPHGKYAVISEPASDGCTVRVTRNDRPAMDILSLSGGGSWWNPRSRSGLREGVSPGQVMT